MVDAGHWSYTAAKILSKLGMAVLFLSRCGLPASESNDQESSVNGGRFELHSGFRLSTSHYCKAIGQFRTEEAASSRGISELPRPMRIVDIPSVASLSMIEFARLMVAADLLLI